MEKAYREVYVNGDGIMKTVTLPEDLVQKIFKLNWYYPTGVATNIYTILSSEAYTKGIITEEDIQYIVESIYEMSERDIKNWESGFLKDEEISETMRFQYEKSFQHQYMLLMSQLTALFISISKNNHQSDILYNEDFCVIITCLFELYREEYISNKEKIRGQIKIKSNDNGEKINEHATLSDDIEERIDQLINKTSILLEEAKKLELELNLLSDFANKEKRLTKLANQKSSNIIKMLLSLSEDYINGNISGTILKRILLEENEVIQQIIQQIFALSEISYKEKEHLILAMLDLEDKEELSMLCNFYIEKKIISSIKDFAKDYVLFSLLPRKLYTKKVLSKRGVLPNNAHNSKK